MHKFVKFLESIKSHDPMLIESIELGFKVWLEADYGDDLAGLEHVTDQYYYDPKSGQYYDRSSDMYLDKSDTTVQDILDSKTNAQIRNDKMLQLLFNDGIINGREYAQNLGKTSYADEFTNSLFTRLKKAGKSFRDYVDKVDTSLEV